MMKPESYIASVRDLAVPKQPGIRYAAILREHGFSPVLNGIFLQVGSIPQIRGWVLHLSVIAAQVPDLLRAILPILKKSHVPFKVVDDLDDAKAILNGQLGYIDLGKIISVYPKDEKQANDLAGNLIDETLSFRPVRVLTDAYLGGAVYTRFGALNPVLLPSHDGSFDYFFKNENGTLIKDEVTIPFRLPNHLTWPFSVPFTAQRQNGGNMLMGRYSVIETLKQDARGNVSKALYLARWWNIRWCLLKEGKRNMFSDDYGRDMKDRLRWQYDLHQELQNSMSIPKVYELFEANDDSFMSMEFIIGKPLEDVVSAAYELSYWKALSATNRLQLIELALKVTKSINALHEKQIVHRDIHPGNFIVNKKQQLYLIDLELCYSIKLKRPSPPFRYGTLWFMSPQQQDSQTPSVKDDIYSLGATLVVILTGLMPNKFSTHDQKTFCEQLNFFGPDLKMAKVLAQCFAFTPEQRPSISMIADALLMFRDRQDTIGSTSKEFKALTNENKLFEPRLIDRAIHGLANPIFLNDDGFWLSKEIQNQENAYYQNEKMGIYGGFFAGLGGVLFLLARAAQTGHSIDSCSQSYFATQHFLKCQYLASEFEIPGGFYSGFAGMLLALTQGEIAGLDQDTKKTAELAEIGIERSTVMGIGVAKGVAGQGIVLMSDDMPIQSQTRQKKLFEIADILLETQEKDGSWRISTDDGKERLKMTGFSHGIAGITCFLLGLCRNIVHPSAAKAAVRSLAYLQRVMKRRAGEVFWHIDDKTSQAALGLHDGTVGIALAFIKAYEVTGDVKYRNVTGEILESIPRHILLSDLTLATGLVGIGETYLEAFKVFGEQKWKDRAEWIVESLANLGQVQRDGSIYWLVNHSSSATADLMIGNSGIIHFLLRYHHLPNLSHPLLTF